MSATSVSSAGRAVPRRATAPRPARRVSGPVTGRARPRTAPQHGPTVGARALRLVRSLPNHSLIDRLVRGRAWIPVLGVLLAGLVTMQVEMLKLGTSLGRSLERTTSLQSVNESLQARVATLADDQRIERLATGMGMVMPSPGLLTFITAHPQGQTGNALANIHPPDPANFAAQLSAQIASEALIAPSAPAASPAGASTTASGTGASTAGATTGSAGGLAGAGTSGGATSGTTSGAGTTSGTTSGSSTGAGAAVTGSPTTGTTTAAGGPGTGSATGVTGAAPTGGTPAGAAGLPSTSGSGSGGSTGG